MNKEEIKILEEKIIDVLSNIYDPEIPTSIYELGLIYKIKVEESGKVYVEMTLTSPNCPVAESLPAQVKEEISFLTGVTEVDLEITFEPPWDQSMMTEEAKLELGLLWFLNFSNLEWWKKTTPAMLASQKVEPLHSFPKYQFVFLF